VSLAVHHLRRRAVIELEPTPPFRFDAAFHKPDHFPSSDVGSGMLDA
jgi:hypothetical protein